MGKIEVHPSCQIPGIAEIFEEYFPNGGYFAEVGAFDGMTYGVTWGLAKAGWHGVYVEAHPDFAYQCIQNHKVHPKIDTYACACGSTDGEITLTVCGEVSTTVLSRWTRDWGISENTPKIVVPMRTLDSILKESEYDFLDLLVVDVEEAEIDVLKGFSINKYRPKMAIIELHEGQGTRPDQKGWQTPWVDEYFKGYQKIYVDNINTIYALPK